VTRALTYIGFAWLCLIVVAALQGAVPLGWGTYLAAPDVLLVVTLFFGLQGRDEVGTTCAVGAAMGYLGDLFHGSPKGLHMLAYALAALGARLGASRLLVRGWPATMLITLMATLGFGALVATLRASFEPGVGWEPARMVPMAAFATALAAPWLFRLLERIERRFIRDARAIGSI
jgi:rod shape-determining protein MreD